MGTLNDFDRRTVQADVWKLMPEEKLDIRSPKIYCKSITKFDPTNVERFRERDVLRKIASRARLDLDDDIQIDRIDHNSLKSARLAVEVIAKYFRREFRSFPPIRSQRDHRHSGQDLPPDAQSIFLLAWRRSGLLPMATMDGRTTSSSTCVVVDQPVPQTEGHTLCLLGCLPKDTW